MDIGDHDRRAFEKAFQDKVARLERISLNEVETSESGFEHPYGTTSLFAAT
jgi:hypothetical protein